MGWVIWKKISSDCLIGRVMNASVNSKALRRRPRFGWINDDKTGFDKRGLSVESAGMRSIKRNEFKEIVMIQH